LDITDHSGFICGKILGDLGADVIKIEPPGGEPSRNIGPFYHDIPDPQKSLYWFAYNANKRSITLDITTQDGREIFKRLVTDADLVIESFPPEYMDRLGLGYGTLSKVNPGVIMVSITPFGQAGPYKNYKGSDIVIAAMAGPLYLAGFTDRAPTWVNFPQCCLHAGAQAAVGAVMALWYRGATGKGQYIDVPMQESVVPAVISARLFFEFGKANYMRGGPYRLVGTLTPQRLVWQCKDGYVCFGIMGGAVGGERNRSLVQWMDREGIDTHLLKNIDWVALDMDAMTKEELDRLSEPIAEFFMTHTMQELYEGALKRGILLYPVNTVMDILKDPQLEARNFWTEVQHEELGETITYPGGFIKLSETYCGIRYRAPLIGEHNQEIYEKELGFSKEKLITLKQAGVI